MAIKALFFDLDGTLLTSQQTLSPPTVQTLTACKERGLALYLATARPPLLKHMPGWNEISFLFDGGVYYNGGCVINGRDKFYFSLADEVVNDAIAYIRRYDELNIALQLTGEKHAFRFPLSAAGYEAWGLSAGEALTLCQAKGLQTVKMLIFMHDLVHATEPLDPNLTHWLENRCQDAAQYYLTDMGMLVQIMAKDVSKKSGIERIRAALGYELHEIAVFGDDTNDLEMLTAYEHAVAMGNAEPDVQKAAKYVTLDHDSDGVAHAIRHLLHLI